MKSPRTYTVQRAPQIADISRHDMCVYLGGLDIGMAEHFLKHPYIDAVFQHMGGETVTERVAAYLLNDARLLRAPLNRFLQTRFKHMVAHLFSGARVHGSFPGRKDPLQSGLLRCIAVFSGKCLWDRDLSESLFKVSMMERLHGLYLSDVGYLSKHPRQSRPKQIVYKPLAQLGDEGRIEPKANRSKAAWVGDLIPWLPYSCSTGNRPGFSPSRREQDSALHTGIIQADMLPVQRVWLCNVPEIHVRCWSSFG